MLDVCLIGTGGMMPLKNRWLTSCYFEYNGRAMLIDCGEGTQIALSEAQCRLSRLDVLLITHFHADHISGLPGLLLSLGNCSKTSPLKIYGGKGIEKIVKNLCCICERLPFPLEITELESNTINEFQCFSDLTVRAMPVRHTCECFGYSVTLNRKPVFNPVKAESLGIPKNYWKLLHNGETVTVDEKTFTPDMVIDGQRKPTKVTYVTDTLPFDAISDFAKNSDLMICEGMYGDDDMKDEMNKKCHMLFSDAVKLAKSAGAEKLWLTHYSPAMQFPENYAKAFPEAVISCDGQKISF